MHLINENCNSSTYTTDTLTMCPMFASNARDIGAILCVSKQYMHQEGKPKKTNNWQQTWVLAYYQDTNWPNAIQIFLTLTIDPQKKHNMFMQWCLFPENKILYTI